MTASQEALALLERAITASGLSARQFARRCLARDERSLRRWRQGRIAVPPLVQAWCREFLAGTVPRAGGQA